MKMNTKAVYEVPAKSVLNLNSGFRKKKLCDGPTFTAGTSCCYSCRYCYVEDAVGKTTHFQDILKSDPSVKFAGIVMRRKNAVEILRKQLTNSKGMPKYLSESDLRVVYASPLVDVAPNLTLANETVEMIKVVMSLTNWEVRLLSKSTFLPKIAAAIAELKKGWEKRIMFGVSTGTLEDGVARAIEVGTPLVSKRIESLHWLQDNGFRTYGMICPSLPCNDYPAFAKDMAAALRTEKMESVYAEALNARGESFEQTYNALTAGGYRNTATDFQGITKNKQAWETYSRALFSAHADVYRNQMATDRALGPKLRFLQYCNKATEPWWNSRVQDGAVIL